LGLFAHATSVGQAQKSGQREHAILWRTGLADTTRSRKQAEIRGENGPAVACEYRVQMPIPLQPKKEATIMANERSDKSGANKPATPAEQKAAQQSTKDGLQKTRDNTQTRREVRQQKTPQGQSNRG